MPDTLGIVLPVYNGEKYIKEAILSVLSQTQRPDEFVVFDNKSTDRSGQIADDLAREHGFTVVHSKVHLKRMVDSWNLAVSYLNTEWFHLLSADDLMRSNFVEEFRKYLGTNCSAISMLSEDITETGRLKLAKIGVGGNRVLQGAELIEMNLWSSKVNVASVAVRRSTWSSLGGYPREFEYLHDLVFWQLLADRGGILKVFKVVARYRVDNSVAKSSPRLEQIRREFELLERDRYPALATEWGINVSRPRSVRSRGFIRAILVESVSLCTKALYRLRIIRW